MPVKTLADDIRGVLHQSDEPLKAIEIIGRLTGSSTTTEGAVRSELSRLKDRGDVVQPRYGYYDLPEGNDNGEAEESEAEADKPATTKGEGDAVAALFRDEMKLTIYTDVRAAAGDGYINYDDQPRQELRIPRHFITQIVGFMLPREVGIIFIDGDSMSPTLRDGDMIIYEPIRSVPASMGGMYVLMIDGELIAKRVQKIPGGGYELMSDNRHRRYKDYRLVPKEGKEGLYNQSTGRPVSATIVGKVIWPTRDTDRMHIETVIDIIRGLSGDPADGDIRQQLPE